MRSFLISLLIILITCSNAMSSSFPPSQAHRLVTSIDDWLNTSRPLTQEDLEGRIVLLDFWTFCCINCMHIIPDLHALEKKYGNKLTVIGVHSAKFTNEKDTSNIRNAILRYDIEHPVVNDKDFKIWQGFGVRSWPTLVLINPMGRISLVVAGEGNKETLDEAISSLINEYRDILVSTPLPTALEKSKRPPTTLSFPGKITYAPSTSLGEFLVVSDSGHNQIVLLTRDGNVKHRIGSGTKGLKDGDLNTAQFNKPQGVIADGDRIYVADTENHAIRAIDLSNKTVNTIAGNGKQTYERFVSDKKAVRTSLASPWDLAFYPDHNHLAIAMAGTHQLWSLDLTKGTIETLAGNGRESIDDGAFPLNSLSQPSGLASIGDKLFFVDSETSSVRQFRDGSIKTLIGTGLFDFGFRDGKQGEALMQHPLGIASYGLNVAIADSYNHSIRLYNIEDKTLTTLLGNGKSGKEDGKGETASFNEPGGLIAIGDTLYIADTNNHSIRVYHGNTGELKTLAIANPSPMTSEQPLTYQPKETLPLLLPSSEYHIHSKAPLELVLQLPDEWKLNDNAPNWIGVFDTTQKLIESLKPSKNITSFKTNWTEAILEGTLYYCPKANEGQCLIASIHHRIIRDPKATPSRIRIELPIPPDLSSTKEK